MQIWGQDLKFTPKPCYHGTLSRFWFDFVKVPTHATVVHPFPNRIGLGQSHCHSIKPSYYNLLQTALSQAISDLPVQRKTTPLILTRAATWSDFYLYYQVWEFLPVLPGVGILNCTGRCGNSYLCWQVWEFLPVLRGVGILTCTARCGNSYLHWQVWEFLPALTGVGILNITGRCGNSYLCWQVWKFLPVLSGVGILTCTARCGNSYLYCQVWDFLPVLPGVVILTYAARCDNSSHPLWVFAQWTRVPVTDPSTNQRSPACGACAQKINPCKNRHPHKKRFYKRKAEETNQTW